MVSSLRVRCCSADSSAGCSWRANTESELVRIDERRTDERPPGAIGNVMIHRLAGSGLLARLGELLAAGTRYEDALNELIATGSAARSVLLDRWVAIKSAEDLVHVEARFGLTFSRNAG